MTSVMVTTRASWYPGDGTPGFIECQKFVEILVHNLPLYVAEALENADSSVDVNEKKILVDAAKFSAIADNIPDVWVVVTIDVNELYVHAKTSIRDHLIEQIRQLKQVRSAEADVSVDVGFNDGTGALLSKTNEVIDSW